MTTYELAIKQGWVPGLIAQTAAFLMTRGTCPPLPTVGQETTLTNGLAARQETRDDAERE